MTRPLRLEFANALYHVTSRGDRREPIFVDDEDRSAWLDVFGQVCGRFNWRCHVWCLMTNHYHLLVETPEPNLSRGMRQLNGVYTQRMNRRHGHVGHVFQGRFKAIRVEREAYLLDLARYVVLNPVRAGMVGDVEAWPWSSYSAMTGAQPAAPWLETDWLLRQFGRQRGPAVAAYIDFVRAGVGLPSVWESLQGQIYLGSEPFIARMQALAEAQGPDLREVAVAQRRPLRTTKTRQPGEPLSPADRDELIATDYATGRFSMRELAERHGIHLSTVSRAVARREAGAGVGAGPGDPARSA
jgi:REP element-mobilizing transposase RayT